MQIQMNPVTKHFKWIQIVFHPRPEPTEQGRKQSHSEEKRGKKLSEKSLTDTDQQKATEKPNQDGPQEIKRKKHECFFFVCYCPCISPGCNSCVFVCIT